MHTLMTAGDVIVHNEEDWLRLADPVSGVAIYVSIVPESLALSMCFGKVIVSATSETEVTLEFEGHTYQRVAYNTVGPQGTEGNDMDVNLVVACVNAFGKADVYVYHVALACTRDREARKVMAIESAEAAGYTSPFIVFTQHEHSNIARVVQNLECPIPFTLRNQMSNDKQSASGEVTLGRQGMSVRMDGYSDISTQGDGGAILMLEQNGAQLTAWAYADINSDEPTDRISFEGAAVGCLVEEQEEG